MAALLVSVEIVFVLAVLIVGVWVLTNFDVVD